MFILILIEILKVNIGTATEMDSIFNVYFSLGKRKECLVNTSLKPVETQYRLLFQMRSTQGH